MSEGSTIKAPAAARSKMDLPLTVVDNEDDETAVGGVTDDDNVSVASSSNSASLGSSLSSAASANSHASTRDMPVLGT